MKIGRDTYGLFLISNNCHNIMDHIGEARRLISELNNEKEGIEVINSWALVGVHDTAILVRADNWITRLMRWVNGLLIVPVKRYHSEILYFRNWI